jgi:glucose-6-phosphate 1-dehydrogenase
MTTSIVIFGASGDLTARKLLPALYHNYIKKRLPDDVRIVGVARRPYDDATFRQLMREAVQEHGGDAFKSKSWADFEARLHYVRADLDTPDDYGKLDAALREHEGENETANRLYYLSVAPEYYPIIAQQLGAHGMTSEAHGWQRIIIEKPFGTDLASAQALNEVVHEAFAEHQVYRIDHYLGKETAQNILFFRFANTIFEPMWNRNYIDNVLITVAETVDVGHRAGYYDKSGVLRDMFQNHLLQLVTLVAMEPPPALTADALRNEKVKVLESIRPIQLYDTVRAQYYGYRAAEGIVPESETPTFAQLKLYVDNWRWQDVPFYLRSGKALKTKASEISIRFRRPPHLMFNLTSAQQLTPNVLTICVQPDEGIHLSFEAKVPDGGMEMRSSEMEFHYKTAFNGAVIPDAYERLLVDALNGDATLFTRSDEITASWRLIDPILQGWSSPVAPPLAFYDTGSWGPAEANEAVALDGNDWQLYCHY